VRNQGRGQSRRRLGIKYCGGCAPTYDRVAAVDRIRDALSDLWELVSWEHAAAGQVLIVAGCETACVDPAPFADRVVYWLTGEGEVPELIATLRQVGAAPSTG